MDPWDHASEMKARLERRNVDTRDGLGDGADAITAWEVFAELAHESADGVGEHVDDDMLVCETYRGVFESALGLGYAPVGTEPELEIVRAARTFTFYDGNDEFESRFAFVLYIACEPDGEGTLNTEVFGYGGPSRGAEASTHPEIRGWVGDATAWNETALETPGLVAHLANRAVKFRFYIDA